MECEVCGRQIYGKGRNVIIEGAKLVVCLECVQFSTSAPDTYREQKAMVKKTFSAPKILQQQAVRGERIAIRDDLELVENYSHLVREARERMCLTHYDLSKKIGEKVSLLQKLETRKMVPNLDLAKRLEYTLKIKLLHPASRVPFEEKFTKKPFELTLGDVVSLQMKKRNKAEEESKREL